MDYEAHQEKCLRSATHAFVYCMHYVDNGAYGGEPCMGPGCDQETFGTICGHA